MDARDTSLSALVNLMVQMFGRKRESHKTPTASIMRLYPASCTAMFQASRHQARDLRNEGRCGDFEFNRCEMSIDNIVK